MSKKYKNKLFEALHESMKGLYEIGVIDAKKMRHFDKVCLKKSDHPLRSETEAQK